MLNIESMVAGRRYSFVFKGTVELVSKRKDTQGQWQFAPAWLMASQVTCRRVFSGNVVNAESYARLMRVEDPTWTSSGASFEYTPQTGIIVFKASRKFALATLWPRTQKSEYFVAGVPATPEQLEAIRAFKKNATKLDEAGKPIKQKFSTFGLDKVVCEGEVLAEENTEETED